MTHGMIQLLGKSTEEFRPWPPEFQERVVRESACEKSGPQQVAVADTTVMCVLKVRIFRLLVP